MRAKIYECYVVVFAFPVTEVDRLYKEPGSEEEGH
jgi:hypothetical protein